MSYVAGWGCDEASGNVLDPVGHNDFSLTGSGLVRSSAGKNGGCLNNTGSAAATPPNVTATSANRTVMAWLKGVYSTAGWPMQWFSSSISSGSWGILIISGQLNIQARNASTLARASVNTPTDIATVWHHVAGTYDGSNVKIYLDGVLSATTALAGPLRTDGVLSLFGYSENNSIDDMRCFDHALTVDEIKFYMSCPVGVDDDGAMSAA